MVQKMLFEKGYTIFITNDMTYIRKPLKINCFYKDFSLEDGIIKSGHMDWHEETSIGTKKNAEKPINLEGKYKIKWEDYSKVDESNSGIFNILINEIR